LKKLVPLVAPLALAALLAGCQPKPVAPKAAATAAPKFNTDLPMTEVMGHVVDPAAFMYWKGSGTMVDAKGEHDLSPTTEEGWETVISGATILMEAGNVLQLEGHRRAPEADWNRYAQMLTDRALIARKAAVAHDKKAVFDEGGKVYEVCVACHEQFVIQPSIKANGPAKGNPLPALPGDIKVK
jgi:hypothetical protein